MIYAKDTNGKLIPITNDGTYAVCPRCGAEHKVDLVSLIIEHRDDPANDILGCDMYCAECSELHLPLWERRDEIEFVASRFPGTSVEDVVETVRNGLDRGLSFDTALTGARLALAVQSGTGELFTLDEVASALGRSNEETAAEMEQLGISPIRVSALPGFGWAFEK